MFGRSRSIEIKVLDSPIGTSVGRRLRSGLLDSHQYKKTKKISFCTVITPHDEFLMRTLFENLQENHRDRSDVEFVVLIPQGWNALGDLRTKFKEELKNSYLKIATYNSNTNRGVLRNLCFQLAEGMILSNVESSDFTGSRAGNFIHKELTAVQHDSLVCFKEKRRIPSRISVWRDTFYEIGGFDEEKEYKDQCTNLIHRLNFYGVKSNVRSNEYFTKSIIKQKWSFFSRETIREVKKLKMTPLDNKNVFRIQ